MLLDELPEQAPVERVQATSGLVPKRAQKLVKVVIRRQGKAWSAYMMISLESPIKDMATERRLFMPPDRFLDFLCRSFSRPCE